MSHQQLQRVCVRMLFDPGLVRRVYADPAAALPELSAEQRSWILANDARAWRTDPERPARALRALFDEFSGSTTLAVAELGRYSALMAFFSSAHFHQEMQARGSMANAYAGYLRSLHLRTPVFDDLLQLEEGLARCRRELALGPERLDDTPAGPWVARAPGVAAMQLDGAVIDTLNAVERCLFELSMLPAMGLCKDAPRPKLPAARPDAAVHLVLQPRAGDSGIRQLGRMVCDVLKQLDSPAPPARIVRWLGERRVPQQASEGLLSDLERAGLLIRG